MPTDADWETSCPKREDKQHCTCWYDGEKCCACGEPAMMKAEKIEAGMEAADAD